MKGLLKLTAVCLLLAGMVACDGGSSIKGVWLMTSGEEWNGTSYETTYEDSATQKMYFEFNDEQIIQYQVIISASRKELEPGIYFCSDIIMGYSLQDNTLMVTVNEESKEMFHELDGKSLTLGVDNSEYPEKPMLIHFIKASSSDIEGAVENCDYF